MLATVSYERLDMPKAGKGFDGNRKYIKVFLEDTQLASVRQCALAALGFN